MDKQAGKGIKDRSLVSFPSNKMIIFKIGLLEPSEVETDYLMTDGRKTVQTDGNNLLNIGIWCHTFQTKKEFLKSDC